MIPSSISARQFEIARPGYTFRFPQDHYSHNKYKIEWWYFTGHLETERFMTGHPSPTYDEKNRLPPKIGETPLRHFHGKEKREFGYQLTFFRLGTRLKGNIRSKWALSDLYFAHLALTDIVNGKFYFDHRISRGGVGQAGASGERLRVWTGNWILSGNFDSVGQLADEEFHLKAATDKLKIDFSLVPGKERVINGKDGFDRKSSGSGGGSHYYSYTRLMTGGTLTWEGRRQRVTGVSWMDHEFCTRQIGKYQQGWDWFSIQLDNNLELMCYHMRLKDGRPDKYSSGTLVFPNGKYKHLSLKEFRLTPLRYWVSPETGGRYPIAWKVALPAYKISLQVKADIDNQELNTGGSTGVNYWEGSVSVSGTYEGSKAGGAGYLEMTGYAGKFDKPI
ncbi:MAG: lipocalin-like domain-containing protein [bacterium]